MIRAGTAAPGQKERCEATVPRRGWVKRQKSYVLIWIPDEKGGGKGRLASLSKMRCA